MLNLLFVIVSIEAKAGIGDCLTVVENNAGTDFYWASRCDLRLYQVCEHGKSNFKLNK